MRLWSLHPKYLDRQGLLAVWREALLAQKVLQGETNGYRHHPQLERFRQHPEPLKAVATYLSAIAEEGERRGYRFTRSLIGAGGTTTKLTVTRGQVSFEWLHLMKKLQDRDPVRAAQFNQGTDPEVHPLFELIEGSRAGWEKGK